MKNDRLRRRALYLSFDTSVARGSSGDSLRRGRIAERLNCDRHRLPPAVRRFRCYAHRHQLRRKCSHCSLHIRHNKIVCCSCEPLTRQFRPTVCDPESCRGRFTIAMGLSAKCQLLGAATVLFPRSILLPAARPLADKQPAGDDADRAASSIARSTIREPPQSPM